MLAVQAEALAEMEARLAQAELEGAAVGALEALVASVEMAETAVVAELGQHIGMSIPLAACPQSYNRQ